MQTLPIDRVIDQLGGPSAAARALGISNPSVVLNWRARGQVSAMQVLAVERATGISRHELRPDLHGPAA